MERAPETAALAGQAGDDGPPQSRGQPRGVFKVDEGAALAELEQAWPDGCCCGFCVLEHSVRSTVTSSGEVIAGSTPDGLDQQLRAHWQVLRSG